MDSMTASTAAETLLNTRQAAERLSCSPSHVYRLIHAGELAAIDIATPGSPSSKTRVRESDLLAYIEKATIR
jgi:excisionase family DNA binding protein